MIEIFKNQKIIAAALLIAATLLVYAPIRNHEFIGLDDNLYVTENVWIQQGLNPDSVIWAMTSFKEGVWNPLTWLSFILDYQLFGLDPAGFYLTNLALHLASAVILFLVLHQLTGALWRSVLVAALFALHPLNVESVAWVTERKNVLSTLFGLLTVSAYVGYVRQPGWSRYLGITGLLALGLMAKQMMVTLPCVLLLLDYWPLGRLGETGKEFQERLPRLVLEKLPLMIPVAVASVLTIVAAQSIGGLSTLENVPWGSRVSNAVLSYALYLKKMLLPTDLAIFYPHPGALLGLGSVALALLVLVGISWGVWWRRESGYPVVGWLWYLGTLFPVIGLVQVGGQAMADRHTYVPLIGVFIMLVWGSADIADRWRLGKIWRCIMGLCVVGWLAVLTQIHLSYWQNSRLLFEHALEVTSRNHIAHNALGLELKQQGDLDAAMTHFQEALQIEPGYSKAHNNAGMILAERGQLIEAAKYFSEALRFNSRLLDAQNNLGMVYRIQGKYPEATHHFLKVLEMDSSYVRAYANMGLVMEAQNDFEEAITWHQRALRISPRRFATQNNLGLALMETGQLDQAAIHFAQAIEINPDDVIPYINLGRIKIRTGQMDEADQVLRTAIEVQPDFSEAYYYLGRLKTNQGQVQAAIDYYQKVLEYEPDHSQALKELGSLLGPD